VLTALDKHGHCVIATETGHGQAPFLCPECGGDLVLKRGTWKIHHFAHRARAVDCDRQAESELHETTKLSIFKAAREEPRIGEALLEHRTGRRIADVALVGVRRKVAVEIQLSPIGEEEIWQRSVDHAAAGFSTMWVVDLDQDLRQLEPGAQYKVRAFQRDIHDLSDGCLFVHRERLAFDLVHLMGYRYVTFKHLKVAHRPIHLFETVSEVTSDDEGRIARLVIAPESARWWERLPRQNVARRAAELNRQLGST
jgi:competence CoiA-like predicted nuclease